MVSKLIRIGLFPFLLFWKHCSMRHTHFSNEINVAFPLLDIWRTLRWNSVSRMSFVPQRCVKNRRQETNFQLIFSILQRVSDREILQKKTTQFVTHAAEQCQNIKIQIPHSGGRTYISTKHVVRAANSDSIEPNG